MKSIFRISLVALVLASSASTHASLVSIDADAFAANTVLNNAFVSFGVTLSAFGSSTDGNVYSRTNVLASTGARLFGNSSGFDPRWIPGGRSLRADFSGGTNFASIDVIADDNFDAGQVFFYDIGGTLLSSLLTGSIVTAGTAVTLSFGSGTSNIAYMVATGFDGENVALDNIRFNSNAVPEPSSLALTFCALLIAGMMGRQRSE